MSRLDGIINDYFFKMYPIHDIYFKMLYDLVSFFVVQYDEALCCYSKYFYPTEINK